MSWIENNNVQLLIRTGDGKIYPESGQSDYRMLYKGATKTIGFNTEGFDFVGVEGTYVAREQAQGTQYPLEFYFEGENHIQAAKDFEISARNKNLWKVYHPIFGEITCQPLSLEFDSSYLNITKVSGTVWETGEIKYPQNKPRITGIIEEKGRIETESSYYIEPSILTESSKLSLKDINDFIAKAYTKLPATSELAVDLKNRIRAVDSTIEELLTLPGKFVDSFYSLVTFVIEVEDNIVSKIKALRTIFDTIRSVKDVSIFEPTANAVLYVAADLSLQSKYKKSGDIVDVISEISNMYTNLGLFYEQNGMIPNSEMALSMDYIVNTTIGNLKELGLSASQERILILEKDSNPIVLAHRFYGFSDDSLMRFLDENNIQMRDMFQIKKGTRLVWYV